MFERFVGWWVGEILWMNIGRGWLCLGRGVVVDMGRGWSVDGSVDGKGGGTQGQQCRAGWFAVWGMAAQESTCRENKGNAALGRKKKGPARKREC